MVYDAILIFSLLNHCCCLEITNVEENVAQNAKICILEFSWFDYNKRQCFYGYICLSVVKLNVRTF